MCCSARVGKAAEPPKWIKPQLTRNGMNRLRATIGCTRSSNDSYRMHARLEGGECLAGQRADASRLSDGQRALHRERQGAGDAGLVWERTSCEVRKQGHVRLWPLA